MGALAYWLATGIALAASVFFALAEGALLSYSPSRLDERLRDPVRRARIEAYLGQIDRYIFSIVVLNAVSDVLLVFACTLAFYAGVEGPLAAASALVTSLVVVILGAEVIPRAFGAHFAEALIPRVLPAIAWGDRLLSPLMLPLRLVHDGIGSWLGAAASTKEERAEEIKDEIRAAALEASREGVLDAQSAEMIEAAIEFKDVEVREIMTPRTEMVSLDAATPVQEAVKIALEQGHSRIPVFEGTVDRILGVLYAKDLLMAWGKAGGAAKDLSLRQLIRKPFFVPETKVIGDLLRELRAKKIHVAVVLDEYGGVAGLVTIEDIIEEVVGEIEDEYEGGGDEPPRLRWIDDVTAELDARMHIDDVNEQLDIRIPENGDYETLGGFLFFALGKVPKKGEKVAREDAEFIVTDGDERRINRVRVRLKRARSAQEVSESAREARYLK